MATQAICIHGHFYQPPREDPLTGGIPAEYGAAPYQNWNERIHAECYRPNAELGNFERLSFNVGPTLFGWMKTHDPETYRKIVEQDRANVARHGVGNAMAQSYNHSILPLASYQDKVTQVRWGIADFEHRFGRKPQGMWLPETAVDAETLQVMAEHGITFTILAPWQADTPALDPTEPYLVSLPNGRQIAVFFYHHELSGRVSFDPAMTTNADAFALHDLRRQYHYDKTVRNEPQLVMVASDGELYGHHQPFRDKFLAYFLQSSSSQVGITPTYPALWLQDHPPRRTIAIRDRTSWSCHHGVTRWSDECGCAGGAGSWKASFRSALNQLASALDQQYVATARDDISDPWELRHRYIHVILGDSSAEDLIGQMAGRRLPADRLHTIHLLLQAQHERQRMFTSCGWFFDDFDRIEPKNNVAYAAQAVRLTHLATGVDLAPRASEWLSQVVSGRTGLRGDQVFEHYFHRTSAV
jgi:alpha-amylase/alpha-mannosidase (GH57 family)